MAARDNCASDNISIKNDKESDKVSPSTPRERTTDPGIQVQNVRIYGPENGKTCHQCRQKTRNFAAFCKTLKKNDKPCPLTFCQKCLYNRYGEKVRDVEKLDDWSCPKCRNVCNCSFCMKRKGYQPTGILARTAKASGFNSVLDLLHDQGDELLKPKSLVEDSNSPVKSSSSLSNTTPGSAKAKSLIVPKSRKYATEVPESSKEEIVLPAGRPLTEIAGVEIPPEDVGAAFQFLEFCNAFSEVLDIKQGQPDIVLRELIRGHVKCHGVHSALEEFNIKLLSLIEKDLTKKGDAWVQTLRRCIEQSECTLKELPIDCLKCGSSGYDDLDPSTKLKILNFLCDEILGTDELRNWINKVALKFEGERKEQKVKILEAKKKEKLLKQQAKDETAKAVKQNAPMPSSESDELISLIKSETDSVCAELRVSVEVLLKKNQRSDAVRTDPIVFGGDGQIFWKLIGYNNRENVILQDIGNYDTVSLQDNWSVYNEEEEKVMEKYISSLRNRKRVRHASKEVEGGKEFDLPSCSESQHCLPEGEIDKLTIQLNNLSI